MEAIDSKASVIGTQVARHCSLARPSNIPNPQDNLTELSGSVPEQLEVNDAFSPEAISPMSTLLLAN